MENQSFQIPSFTVSLLKVSNVLCFCDLGDDSFASYFGKLLLQRLLTRDEEGDAIAACSGVLVYFFACERERIRELLVSTLERYCRMQDLDFDLNALLMHERQNPCDRSVQDAFRETLYRFINKARQLTRLH